MSFLQESNAIERVYGVEALIDAKKAWDYAMKQGFLGNQEVMHIHQILMSRLAPRIAGKLRDCDVYIGGKRKLFVSWKLLWEQLNDALTGIVTRFGPTMREKEQIAKELHVLFEDVHPFEDGNGRTGRIIYNWHRLQMGLPLHIIHEGPEQMEYYEWFRTKEI